MKISYYFLTIFSIILLFSGCKTKNNNLVEIPLEKLTNGNLTEVTLKDQYLTNVDKLIVNNNLLIAVNSGSNNGIFTVFNLPNLKFAGSCGMKGNGPNEFIFLNEKTLYSYKNQLVTIESNKILRLTIEEKNDTITFKQQNALKIVPEFANPYSMTECNDSLIVIGGVNDDLSELRIFNIRTKEFTEALKYTPFDEMKNLMPKNVSTIFINKLFKNNKTGEIASIYSYLPMVKIFSNDLKNISNSILSNWKEQVFKEEEGIIPTKSLIMYYLDATASDDYIFALYLGVKGDELAKKNPEEIQPELHIWNWKGKLMKRLKLNKFVNKIAVDQNNNVYAVSFLHENKIYILSPLF